MTERSPADEFRVRLNLLSVIVGVNIIAVLAVVALMLVYAGNKQEEFTAEQNKTAALTVSTKVELDKIHNTLCTFVDDLQVRVVTAKVFLENNPEGIPGITEESIQQSIDNQQRTIDSLKDLKC